MATTIRIGDQEFTPLGYLEHQQKEEEEEESETGHECGAGDCAGGIDFGDEIFLLRVHRLHQNEQGVFLYDEVDEHGDYMYVPYFVCEECWLGDQEGLMNTIQGESAVKSDRHLRQCDACMSSINSGELVGLLEYGCIVEDPREPVGGDDQPVVNFAAQGEPMYLCTRCLYVLNVEVRAYWEKDIRHGNECPDGLDERCWRSGECQHVCKHERAWQWASENST